ncbi:DNA-binding protein [Chengkuizengella sp. YPA3-1-1]|uniref:DNA-binding protein n=1 Tax=Chengkuizengella marina TaxID=2507566 RepID=A0A6N9Q7S2_9BACL|nr:DNA-binding protein [Chengkuizengella marina]
MDNYIQDLPDILSAQHIKKILHISERRAYEIMELKSFPLIRIGRSKRVSKDSFFSWLHEQERKDEVLLN